MYINERKIKSHYQLPTISYKNFLVVVINDIIFEIISIHKLKNSFVVVKISNEFDLSKFKVIIVLLYA